MALTDEELKKLFDYSQEQTKLTDKELKDLFNVPSTPLQRDLEEGNKNAGSTIVNFGRSLLSGLANIGSNLLEFADTMAENNDFDDSLTKTFIEKHPGLYEKNIDPAKHLRYSGGYEKASNSLKKISDNLRPEDRESILDAISRRDWKATAKNIFYSVGETTPQILGMIAATAAGSPQAGLGIIGASATGGKHGELEDRENVSENKALAVSLASGLIEVGLESVGTGRLAKKLVGELGSETIEKIAKEATWNTIVKGGASEFGEEFTSGVLEGTIDTATGIENYSWKDILESGLEQGIPAIFSGGLMGTGTAIRNNQINHLINKQGKQLNGSVREIDTKELTKSPEVVTNEIINTSKYGKLKALSNDPKQPTVLVENDLGNTFMVGRQALENQLHGSETGQIEGEIKSEGETTFSTSEPQNEGIEDAQIENKADEEVILESNIGDENKHFYVLNRDIDMKTFANKALNEKRGERLNRLDLISVSDGEAARIKELTGKDVKGFRHIIADDDIRHIMKKHGNPEAERKRGQIAVTTEDFDKIPEVLSDYDSIERAEDSKDGAKRLLYKKRINGHAIMIETISNRKKSLRVTTMWKLPSSLADHEVNSAQSDVRNESGLTTSTNNNIPLKEKNSNYPSKEISIDEDRTINISISAPTAMRNAGDFIKDSKTAIELPEIVEIATGINEGKFPHIIKKFRSDATQGRFIARGQEGAIELRASIFTGPQVDSIRLKPSNKDMVLDSLKARYPEDEYKIETVIDSRGREFAKIYQIDSTYAPKVLAHEVGHLADWLPDKTMSRGNILGRIASLKNYLTQTMEDSDLGKLERDKIMDELKQLTHQWKPFDINADPNYTRYRYHSAELYADAVSVLINNPELLQETAPTFYEAFNNYMDKKPEFKAAYEDIKRRMHNRKVLNQNRAEKAMQGYQRGLEKRQQMIRDNQNRPESAITFLDRVLNDQNADILKCVRKYLRDQGTEGNIARKARNMLEELPYLSSEIEDYYYQAGRNVIEAAFNSGIDINQLGLYLRERRILSDRTDIANPGGTTTDVASEQIENLKNELSEEKFNSLVELANRFYDLRQEYVVSRIEESGMFDSDLVEHIKDNREYVTFSIIKYLDSEYGEGTGSGIYRQYGTLSQEENPLVATLLKDASLLASININEAKQAAVIALREFAPDIITEAPTKYYANVKKMVPEKPGKDDMELLTFMVDGNIAGYHVPKLVADTFRHDPYTANTITNTINTIMQGIKNLWVSRNPGWMIYNIPRDFIRTVESNPEIGLTDIPELIKKYKEGFKEAWSEIRRGERSEDISEMRRNRMLAIERMYQPRDTKTDDEVLSTIEGILNKIDPEEIKEHGKVVTAMKNVWDWLGDVGQTTEMAGKLGGFKYLRENTGLAMEELGHRVRTRVGTPDFKRRGEWHNATNNIFVFSTIRKEGLRSAYEAYRDNPASFIWKVTMLSIIPKLIQIGLENADKFLPDNEYAETIANIMQGISKYKKENYLVIPLYMRSDGKSVAATLPQDFSGQFLGNLIYDLAKLDFTGAAKATLEQSPYNPSNINPLAKLGWDIYNYVSGNNVYDIWRGRNVISEESMALGGIDKFKDFASYEYGQLGGSTIVDPNIRYADSTVEKVLNTFPFNAFGRFIEISDYGFKEDINKVYELQRKANALVNKHKTQMRERGRSSIPVEEARKAYRDLDMYNRITTIFSGGRRRIQQIELDDRLSEEEKRRKINEIESQMVNMARKALGKETLGE